MPEAAISPPSAWVVRFAPLIPAGGAVCDVAAGGGRHARHLLARGHSVVAVDMDLSGLADIAGQPRLECLAADLESGAPWPLAGRRFAGVVVTNYLWRPILGDIVNAVADGGVLIYETFAAGNEAYGKPRRPDYLLQPGELLAATQEGFHIVAYEHGIVATPRPAVMQRLCAVRGRAPRAVQPAGESL